MPDWQHSTLGQIVDLTGGVIQTGPFGSQLHQEDYTEEGVPVVMPKDIQEGRVSEDSIARIPEALADRLSKHRLAVGDIVYGRRGDIGRQALIRPREEGWLCGTGCLRVGVGRSIVEPEFLHYLLRVPALIRWISNHAIGATMPNLNTSILRSVPVAFPALTEQRRIAGILSAYDDLIENCERRIRVLDEMARTLYREWFVRFRYPGHEGQSASGSLPHGWQRVPISQVYAGLYDGPHATPTPSSEGPVFLGIGNITADGWLDLSEVRHIAEEEFPRWTKRATPQAGDIVFTYEATLHRYALIPDGFRGCLGRRLALIRTDPTKQCTYFLFYTLLSDAWREVVTRNILSGSTVDRIPLSRVPEFPISLPPARLVARFDEVARAVVEQQARLIALKTNLRETRDLLIPRLLSGQLSVEDAA